MAGRTSRQSRRRAGQARAEIARARRQANRRVGDRGSALASLGFIGTGLAGLWMGLANSVGWLVRAVGRQAATAKDLDPEHRRDGAGLLALGLGIVLAVTVWVGSAGPFGLWLATTTRLLVGAIAAALPVLLVVVAIRLMRAPGDPARRGRGLVGWTALLVAGAGLLHLARRQPTEADLTDRAGGLLGRGVGSGLAVAVTTYVAVPLLFLLAVFGLLVVTATPINKIPARLAAIWRYLVGASIDSTVEGGEVLDHEERTPELPSLAPVRPGSDQYLSTALWVDRPIGTRYSRPAWESVRPRSTMTHEPCSVWWIPSPRSLYRSGGAEHRRRVVWPGRRATNV